MSILFVHNSLITTLQLYLLILPCLQCWHPLFILIIPLGRNRTSSHFYEFLMISICDSRWTCPSEGAADRTMQCIQSFWHLLKVDIGWAGLSFGHKRLFSICAPVSLLITATRQVEITVTSIQYIFREGSARHRNASIDFGALLNLLNISLLLGGKNRTWREVRVFLGDGRVCSADKNFDVGVTAIPNHHIRFLWVTVLQYRKLILTRQIQLLRIRLDTVLLLEIHTVEVDTCVWCSE